MSIRQGITTNAEDILPYAIPISVALASFNWATLFPPPGYNPFLVATAFGFLAKLLVGVQQNGWKSWEDWIPSLIIGFGFLAATLATYPNYLAYATFFGFLVKALGTLQAKSESGYIEDGILAIGAIVIAYGTYSNNAEVVSVGALLALIGKTIPSLATSSSAASTVTTATPAPTIAGV
jgi:hypothetical protein